MPCVTNSTENGNQDNDLNLKGVFYVDKNKEKTQITSIRNELRYIATDSAAIKRKISKSFKQLHAHKFHKVQEIDNSSKPHQKISTKAKYILKIVLKN